MKLTAFTDYSLRVLIYLAADTGAARHHRRDRESFGVSENHLTKVVHFLGKQGWLANVRGKGGGLGWRCRRRIAWARSCATPKARPCRPNASRGGGHCSSPAAAA